MVSGKFIPPPHHDEREGIAWTGGAHLLCQRRRQEGPYCIHTRWRTCFLVRIIGRL